MLSRLPLSHDQHLAYVDQGDAAEALLLLHGGGHDHRAWTRQLSAFPDTRVIAPDARAHGESSTPESDYRLVDDVVALLDALALDRVVVAGVSMGAGTAVDLAVEHPARVRGLVVSGTGTSDPDFRDPWVLDIFATWQRAAAERDPEAWVDGFARFVPGPRRSVDQVDPEVVAANDDMVRNTLNTHVLPVVARGRYPIEPTRISRVNERRRHIDVPVLGVIGGSDAGDHIRLARELLAEVPYGREVVIPDTAHYPNMEKPREFDSALREFLDDLGDREALRDA